MLNKLRLFGDITKSEKKPDGTLIVCGYASSGAIDSDGESITPEAMKAAIPKYMEFGCVREMHGSNAAGTALNIRVEDDGRTYFEALIVDPIAIMKCELGVYKGFSIGAIVKARDALNKMVIKAIELFEISLVDRPANPEALFELFKGINMQQEDKLTTEVETPVEVAEKGAIPQGEVITKGLGNVNWLNNILQDLVCLQECATYDGYWESNASLLPEELKSVISELAKVLNKEVANQTAELTVATKSVSLEEDKDLVKKFMDFVKAQKSEEEKESITKFNTLNAEKEELVLKSTKLQEEKDLLESKIKELESIVVPSKIAKTITVVSKEEDNSIEKNEDKFFNVYKEDGSLDVIQTSIKKNTYSAFAGLLNTKKG